MACHLSCEALLMELGLPEDKPCIKCSKLPREHRPKKVKGNVKVTVLSDHGTVQATYLLLDKAIPKTVSDFWSLISGAEQVNSHLLKNGKATVLTKNKRGKGDGVWIKLQEIEVDMKTFRIDESSCYQFQVQRFSTPYSWPTQPVEMTNVHTSNHQDTELVDHVRKLFSANPFENSIPSLHIDDTILNLREWLEKKPEEFGDAFAVATLFAMPGSGKTKSVQEAAKLAKSKHKRIRICDANYEEVKLCNDYVASLTKSLDTDTDTSCIFSFHFDEVQTLLVAPEGEKVLKALAAACTAASNHDKRLKFIFTGTNINARSPINLGSHLKAKPFFMDGSFPMDFTRRLYETHLEQTADADTLELLERCRHNRRVTSFFLGNLWKDKDTCNDSNPQEPAYKHYNAALASVKTSITSQMGADVTPAACRIFRVLLQAINAEPEEEREAGSKVIKIAVDNASDLRYVTGGGLNVCQEVEEEKESTGKYGIHVFLPGGCVFEILMKLMGRAVQHSTYQNLLSFLRTSRLKTFNLGWFVEALVVYDLQCASSEFEDRLGCGSRDGNILGARVVNYPKLWELIPNAAPGDVIWWVRDETNPHQNRWIDIAYRQQDGKIVIIESKSGANTSGAAKTFFNNAIALAKKHATMQWIAVYLCLSQPNQNEMPTPAAQAKANNLQLKFLVLPATSEMAKTLNLGRVRPVDGDEELMPESAGSGGIQSNNDGVYAGGSQQAVVSTPRNEGKKRKVVPSS